MAKKTSMCVCPKCGGYNIEYVDLDYEDDYVIHKCSCYDCDFDFKEYERLEYDGYAYDDEDGNTHEFNAKGEEMRVY